MPFGQFGGLGHLTRPILRQFCNSGLLRNLSFSYKFRTVRRERVLRFLQSLM